MAAMDDQDRLEKELEDAKFLVLDLDQTLLNNITFCDRHEIDPEHKHHEIVHDGVLYHEHFRPFLAEFFAWCQENGYKLIIWSAVGPEALVKRVGLIQQVFGIQVIDTFSALEMVYGDKDLHVICRKHNLKLEQVLAVDDLASNYSSNPGKCIYIKPWFSNTQDQELMVICKTITKHFEGQDEVKKV